MNSSDYVDTKPLEELVRNIGVEKVFGEPVKEDGVTLIPVAQVMFGFGYGGGGDGSSTNGHSQPEFDLGTEAEDDEPEGEAGGGGAGAGGRATPRGFIRIEDGRVSYSAIEDERWVPLAGILMVAWMVFWVMATVRSVARQVAQTRQLKA